MKMNREIKFRAYDSINKVMEYNVNVNKGKPVKQGYQWFNTSNTVYNSELMQYTGLKDKNGKEIYEGDIVKSYTKTGGWEIDSVDFKEGRFVLTDKEGILADIWLGDEDLEAIEVIGNIYENQELLDK